MEKIAILTASEQVAEHLRRELEAGTWSEWLPGEAKLANELSVGRDTVTAAVQQLETEGWLVSEGRGKRRRIVRPAGGFVARKLRVMILLYDNADRGDIDNAVLLSQLQEEGFQADFAAKSLQSLGMDVTRVARFVQKCPADAWVVSSASREIIEWFSGQEFPAIAMYGRSGEVPIAAAFPVMIPALLEAVRRLIELGHTRIVMLAREERRKPNPSRPEQLFLDELNAAGIATSAYNLPDWEESRDGLIRRIDQLFRISPPTAILFQEPSLFIAARSYLADCGIVAPRDISLILLGQDPSFAWHKPEVSHIRFDYHKVVRRVIRWAKNAAQGKDDRRRVGTQGEFIEGGTIGPVPKGR